MRIEIIKTENGFQIPQLESMTIPDRLFATVELPSPAHQLLTLIEKKTARQLIEKAVADLGGDDLLEGILDRLPQSCKLIPVGLRDEDVLYEALKEKYGL
jgi:hypothetical protein